MTVTMEIRSAPTAPPLVSPPVRRTLLKRIRNSWQVYVILLPPIVFAIVFLYWPLYGLQLAFKDYDVVRGITGSPWVGFKYIEQYINSYLFWPTIANTLIISLYALVAVFPLPILLALALNTVRSRLYSKSVQMITYAPHFISTVVVVGMLVMMFSPSGGVVNRPIEAIFGEPINVLSADGFRHAYVWSGAWQTMGFSAIIYLAALAGVDPQLHEAAKVDGAGILRRIWHIDLPSILPVMVTLLILDMGNILSTGFEKILLMQNPTNLDVSQVIDTYSFAIAFQSQIPQYSYATAIGLFKAVISLFLLLLANWFAKRVAKQSLF